MVNPNRAKILRKHTQCVLSGHKFQSAKFHICATCEPNKDETEMVTGRGWLTANPGATIGKLSLLPMCGMGNKMPCYSH